MALFGRESEADRQRAERVRHWAQARTPYALVGLACGLLAVIDSFTLVIVIAAGVAAIVLGIVALKAIQRQPELLGRRLAVAAIVLGAFGVVLSLLMWLVILPALA